MPVSQKGSKFLVLTGCIIKEEDIQKIEEDLRAIKQKYYQNPNIEIKSNFLRYANPDRTETSPLKLNSKQKYDELESDVTKFLKKVQISLYTVVVHKEAYWEQYPSQNPYDIAYTFLLERFQKYLKLNDSLGICIIDPREGQVEKHFMGNQLNRIHNRMRWGESDVGNKCPNIVEKLLFSQSDGTIGIQIADLYCYPVFNIFEYNKESEEYWRFNELSLPKLVRDNGKLDGIGLKFFPDKTKKDLNFFK